MRAFLQVFLQTEHTYTHPWYTSVINFPVKWASNACDLLVRSVAAEQQILGGDHDIFLRKVLHVDAHSKKGDPTEPKTLV